jgi:FlaA1/EpsC-like NDP-sugar epimerase
VTHPEMRRFFMTIPEAVHLVLEAGGGAAGGELFVLNMGEPVRIVDLAEDLVELSGFRRGEIPIEFTGMRPGEKLDERLWEDGAQVTAIRTGDVLRVFEGQTDEDVDLESGLVRLERAAEASDALEIQRCLVELIPTFVPGLPETAAVLPTTAPR